MGIHRAPEQSINGLSTNGLSTNGLSTNGLSTNGLSTNGLSTNGLSTNGFSTWFEADPTSADTLMQYIVKCAVASGQTRSYTKPGTSTTYTWTGGLGLAPGWASGQAATVTEQQVVSACLAAHANKYGLHVSISVLGRDAQGTAVPYSAGELTTYAEKEACFFGNLFNGTGVFAATDRSGALTAQQSTPRACGVTFASGSVDCAPIVHVGSCSTLCTRGGDSTLPYYTQCTYNGTTYQPITTRMRPEELYRCGDGVCQFTESCGTSNTAASCAADCGACPDAP